MRSFGRRATMIGGAGLTASCGFHPLLAPSSSERSGAAAQLRTIYIGSMPERGGQVFRAALQARFGGSNDGSGRTFELVAPIVVAVDATAIQRDNSITRFTVTASSGWSLVALTPARPLITSGSARVLDGYDQINQQYLSSEFANEDLLRRITNSLADQIAQQLATYFDGLNHG